MNGSEELLFYDSPDNIQKCLNCEREQCTNCLGQAPTKYGRNIYAEIDREKFTKLFNEGLTDEEIGARFGLPRHTIANYRRWAGLYKQPPNRRGHFDHDKFMELYKQGLGDKEIAMRMKYSDSYIWRYRHNKLKLPTNHPKKEKK